MKYSKEQIERILHKGENEQVEFKSHIRDPFLLSKIIGAFANKNGGVIIVGVQEPIKIIGCNFNKLEKILKRAKTIITPIPKLELSKVEIDEKIIGIIDIEKSEDIIFSSGEIFQRQSDMIKPMSSLELKDKLVQFAKPKNQDFLAEAIVKQSKIIEELRNEINKSNSFRSKLKDYLIGGIIGAILGLFLSLTVAV